MQLSRAALLVAWTLALAGLTLTPGPSLEDAGGMMSAYCLICGDRGTADAALNVLLFAPLGALLADRRNPVVAALLTGLGISMGIELLQLLVPGRHATFGDVAWNALGAMAGALAVGLVARRAGASSVWVGRGITLIVAAWFVLAGFLLQHQPTRAAYYGQWTADLGHMPEYEGRLLSARLGGLPIPDARFSEHAGVPERLDSDWSLTALIVKGPAPESVSPIVSIYDAREVEILLLGAHGEDLVLREHTHAKEIRLDHPDLRLVGALQVVGIGDTISIGASRHGDDRCLSVGSVTECGLGFTPGRTWSLLLHPEWLSKNAYKMLDAAWMLALLVPVGVLARSPIHLGVSLLLVAVSIATGVGLTRLMAPPGWEVAAALGGSVSGWVAVRRGLAARSGARG